MSHYVDVVTTVKSQTALVRALERMGFKGKIETHAQAQNLIGYGGDTRPQKAHVIIRRHYVGAAANDIGFEKLPSGSFIAHISEFDHGKYGVDWQNKLYTYCNVETAKEVYEKKGWAYKETTDDQNRIRLVASF